MIRKERNGREGKKTGEKENEKGRGRRNRTQGIGGEMGSKRFFQNSSQSILALREAQVYRQTTFVI